MLYQIISSSIGGAVVTIITIAGAVSAVVAFIFHSKVSKKEKIITSLITTLGTALICVGVGLAVFSPLFNSSVIPSPIHISPTSTPISPTDIPTDSTSTSSLTPTTKPGDPIYQSDFTNRANEWPGGTVFGGALVFNTNDTNPDLVLPALVTLTNTDYEVDAKIKILDNSGYPCGNIGIFARSTKSSAYEGILKLCETGSYPHVAIDACSMNVIVYCPDNSTYDFSPQPETPFTLSLEVQGLHIALLLNGTKVASQDSTEPPVPGQAGVIANQVNAEILSFKIVAV